MKKLLVLLLCAMFLLCGSAAAYEVYDAHELTYVVAEYNGRECAVVLDYNMADDVDNLVIPSDFDGLPVGRIKVSGIDERLDAVYSPDVELVIHQGNPTFVWVKYVTWQDYLAIGGQELDGATEDALVVQSVARYEWDTVTDHYNVTELAQEEIELLGEIHGRPLLTGGSYAQKEEKLICDGFTYRVEGEEENNPWCIITALPEGQKTVVIPEKLNGYRVENVTLEESFPAEAEVVFLPNHLWIHSENVQAEFIAVRYMDYDRAQEWGSRCPADMTADDYAVMEIQRHKLIGNNDITSTEEGVTFNSADLPAEIGGKKLLAGNVDNLVTSGSLFTYVPYNNDSVKITAITPEADQTVVVIPAELDGKRVERIDLEQFPEQIEVVYIHDDCWMTVSGGKAQYIQIEYVDYEYVQKNKDNFKSIAREMGEDDVALYRINRYTVESGSSSSNNIVYPAEQLLDEINGRKAWNGLSYYYLSYEADGMWYSFNNDDHSSVKVVDMPVAEGELLFIPSSINGLPVSGVDMRFVGEAEEITVLCPSFCWLDYRNDLELIHVYQYTDRFYREHNGYSFDSGVAYLYADTPTVGITNYTRYEYGDEVDDATVEYMDVPTQYGDIVLRNKLHHENLTQYTHGDYSYVKLNDSEIAIVKYNNEFTATVTVPNRLDGLTVTAIFGDPSAYNGAFQGSELTSLELPSSLKVLGDFAIYAYNLKTITIPSTLEEIGDRAFYNVSYKANSLKLPEGLTKLGASWSSGFGSRLKTVKLPSTVTEIPAYSFYGSDMAELKLTDSVKSIGASAFEKMSYLKTLTLPATLTEIPARMVANSEKLAKLTIPENVVSIGNDAFAGCAKLTSVTYKSKGALTTIGDGAFTSSGLTKFAPPKGVTTIGANAAASCAGLTTVELPATVTTLGSYAFSGCEKLTKVTLNEGLTAIPEGLFMGCKKLAAITIPASVTEIGEYAFEGCSAKLVITVYEGSYAEEWANKNGVTVKVKKGK